MNQSTESIFRLYSLFRKLIGILAIATILGFSINIAFAHEGHNEAFGGGEAATTATNRVVVDPEGQKAIGLKVQTVTLGSLDEVLQVTGQVQAAENRAYDINPTANGVVRQVYVKQGDTVAEGQSVASLYSPEVAQTVSTLLQDKARIQAQIATSRTQAQRDIAVKSKELELNRVNYLREQTLFQEGVSAQKDFIQAKNAYETSQVELAALKRQSAQQTALLQRQLALTISAVKSQLKVIGLSGATVERDLTNWQVSSTLPIISPVSGIVTFRDVTPGETLNVSKRIFSIVNLRPIWVVVNVFQEQLPQIKLGQNVQITTASGQAAFGKISSIGTIVDPTQRTLPVRIVSENTTGLLKPGMFARAEIVTGKSGSGKMVIPNSALVEDAGRTLVYIKQGNAFIPTPVQVGAKTAEAVEILDGLYPGDQIVSIGATQIHAQALLSRNTASAKEASAPQDSPEKKEQPMAWTPILIGILIGIGGALISFWLWALLQKRSRRSVGR
jgi:cobalt-zinc-cadmium efflux system membrane fusion protein